MGIKDMKNRALKRAEELSKKVLREAYWAFAADEDEHNSRMAVFYFKEDTDDSVVIAKVNDTLNRMGSKPTRITRHKKNG